MVKDGGMGDERLGRYVIPMVKGVTEGSKDEQMVVMGGVMGHGHGWVGDNWGQHNGDHTQWYIPLIFTLVSVWALL